MTLRLLEQELAYFLSSREPEVICIKGPWGVGKTYAWKKFLKRVRDEGKLALDSYSYVSLFGIDSLEQLKYAVFENSISAKDIGDEPTLASIASNLGDIANQIAAAEGAPDTTLNLRASLSRLGRTGVSVGRRGLSLLQHVPIAKTYAAGALPSLSFFSLQRKLVCIDDLERKGQHLPMRDVLGLVSHLRDQKKCKVVVILNSEELVDHDKEDFDRYNEKVIDRSLDFSPSAAESVDIALTEQSEQHNLIRQHCIALGIANIRVIKKIEQFVLRAAPLLQAYHSDVRKQAVHSITLLTWQKFSADAPSLDFIRAKRGRVALGISDDKLTAEEQRWNALLDAYQFTNFDEFDLGGAQSPTHSFRI